MEHDTWIEVGTLSHWSVVCCWRRRLVRLARTPTPFASAEQLEESFVDLERLLAGFPARRWGICIDFRRAPYTHDPAVEAALVVCRRRVTNRFHRYAAVVKTAAAKMQSSRIRRRQGRNELDGNMELFLDMDSAIDWATPGPVSLGRPPAP